MKHSRGYNTDELWLELETESMWLVFKSVKACKELHQVCRLNLVEGKNVKRCMMKVKIETAQ